MSDKQRIAKNTLLLYIRMFFVMGISIFTSRIVLEKLGIDNYGIYVTVGGIVGLMSFIHGALNTGTSRFITFALGTKDEAVLKNTFSTSLTVQFLLIALLFLVTETFGLWFVKHKLIIPPQSYDAAIWTYHISIFSVCLGLLGVPFSAAIIAHEKMGLYAYTTIFNVSANLGICYLLSMAPFNKLIFYALLMLAVTIISLVINVIYCLYNFPETHYKPIFDKKIFKNMAGFSGWSLFASTSLALNNQGILILLNMFFSPAVVAARSISLTVNGAATSFVNNFRVAANPQIVKHYAAGEYDESKNLLLSSTKFSYYLMFILSLPICVGAYDLLHVWLKQVPPYTTVFLQLVIIQSLFQVFDSSFYMALYAKGNLKANALISPTLGFIQFPVVFILFKFGFSPVTLSWASLIVYAVLGLIVKPILLIKTVDYNWSEIYETFRPCIIVSIVAGMGSWLILSLITVTGSDFLKLVIKTSICLVVSIPSIYYLGMNGDMRKRLKTLLHSRIKSIGFAKILSRP